MANALILTAPGAMTAPLAGTPVLRTPGERVVLTSDGFSGKPGGFAGRLTDTAKGGSPLIWASTSDSTFRIDGTGRAASTDGTGGPWFHYLDIPGNANREIELGLTIKNTSTANYLYVDLFRDVTDGATSRKLRALFTSTAFLISDSQGASGTTNISSNIPYKPGDMVSVKYNTATGALNATLNGVSVVSMTYLPARKYGETLFGIAAAATLTGLTLDDFILTETIL